jgi:uncharacterized protein (DUF433 family)
MASRKIILHCDIPARDILCTAIREYAHTAYPEGGSECAQVARYTLLELASEINAGISEENISVEISKRPKQMVKAALEFYFDRQDEERGTTSRHQRELFVSLLSGEPVTGVELKAAVAADSAS